PRGVQAESRDADAPDEPNDGQRLSERAKPARDPRGPEEGNGPAAAALHGVHADEPEPDAVGGKGRVEDGAQDARCVAEVADAVARDARQRAAQQELRDDGPGGGVARARLGAEAE